MNAAAHRLIFNPHRGQFMPVSEAASSHGKGRRAGRSGNVPNNCGFLGNKHSYRTWLSSDYMLGQLGTDPAHRQKRLGDGFYEQRLLREQIAQLTGRRFLNGYANDEAQFRALMDAGLTYAHAHQLIPGIALSAEQMAQLTSDIVWLVEKEVTLADGSTQQVLVPQLYVRVRDSDLATDGTLIAGETVDLNLTGDLVNAGTIAGRTVVGLTAKNIRNLGGRIDGNSVNLPLRLSFTCPLTTGFLDSPA